MNTTDLKALLAQLGWEVVGVDVGVPAYHHPDLPGVFVDVDDESTRLEISVGTLTVRDVDYSRTPTGRLKNLLSKHSLVLEIDWPTKKR